MERHVHKTQHQQQQQGTWDEENGANFVQKLLEEKEMCWGIASSSFGSGWSATLYSGDSSFFCL